MRASTLLVLLGSLVLISTAGCLRTRIDLCSQVPVHPECAFLDAGRDSPAIDAPSDVAEDVPGDVPADAGQDAGASDAPVSDAPPDAGT